MTENKDPSGRYHNFLKIQNFLFMFFLGVFWVIAFTALSNFLLIALLSFAFASVTLIIFSYVRLYLDKKYKNVSATLQDYILLNLPIYLIVFIPIVFLSVAFYYATQFGNLVILFIDGFLLLLFAVSSKIQAPLLLRGKSLISNSDLAFRAKNLAAKMGVEHADFYSLGWKKFKVANAFQMGPRHFSVLLSDYLLENFSAAEVDAVIAHELAHAKHRDILKLTVSVLFFSLTGIDLMFSAVTAANPTLPELVLAFGGFVLLFGGLFFVIPYISRGFELKADQVAVQTLGNGDSLISALEKLGGLNLVPNKKSRMGWGLSHPSVPERVERIRKIAFIRT